MFTKKSDYGIRGLLNLASREDNRPALVSEVSEAENIPASFLNKIFQSLVRAGILRSSRGYRGGFRLAVNPEDLTVKRIVEVIEGKLTVARTQSGKDGGIAMETVGTLWQRAQLQVEKLLEGTTLYDLLQKYLHGKKD